jgi:hypothetical protein
MLVEQGCWSKLVESVEVGRTLTIQVLVRDMKVAVPQVVADCELMFAHLRQHGSNRMSERVPAHTRDSDPSECRLYSLFQD